MSNPVDFVELWRGGMLESVHQGHAVVVDEAGEIDHSWGDPHAVTFPRSSAKMLQALPMVESGVADRIGLTTEQLALSCASHSGAAIHTDRVQSWLKDLELDDDAFNCGPQWPADLPARDGLIKGDATPCRYHNNCSGKHCGFLTMTKAKAQFALAMHIGRWAGVQRLRQGRRAALGVWARQRDETIADSCRDTW